MHPPFSSRQSIKFRSGNLTRGAAAAGAQKLGLESNSSMLRYWRTKHLKKEKFHLDLQFFPDINLWMEGLCVPYTFLASQDALEVMRVTE